MTRLPADKGPPRRKWNALLYTAMALTTLWGLASGGYIAFHDRLLGTLLSRQAAMQYAYEDRIAELQGALEGATARTLGDDASREDTLHDLAVRSTRLQAQTERLEALLGIAGRAGDLRSHAAAGGQRGADRGPDALKTRFTALESRQKEAVDTLLERTELTNGRTQNALAALGLASGVRAEGGTGGPFVPLDRVTTVGQDFSLLEQALAYQRRLDGVANRLPLRQPLPGPLEVTSGFGVRRDPFYGRLALHTGIDLREDFGGMVRAVASGTVTIAGSENGYGTLIEIDHGNGYATRYAHLSALSVKVGQTVEAGAMIGEVGTTGRSTGPHLHYEVRIAGEPVDPARYLALAAEIARK